MAELSLAPFFSLRKQGEAFVIMGYINVNTWLHDFKLTLQLEVSPGGLWPSDLDSNLCLQRQPTGASYQDACSVAAL